jgi:hypothetical protein
VKSERKRKANESEKRKQKANKTEKRMRKATEKCKKVEMMKSNTGDKGPVSEDGVLSAPVN